MHNFNQCFYSAILLSFICGCSELSEQGFFSAANSKVNKEVKYQNIHQLKLVISDLYKEVDETGFSPVLRSNFQLNELSESLWPQAWIVFSISIRIKDKELAKITRANAMLNHNLNVEFEQSLPSFGINHKDLDIVVTPITWMPSFPLQINPVADIENIHSSNQTK